MATPTPNIVGDTTADNFGTPPNDNTTPLTSGYSNTGSVPISNPNASGITSVPTNNASQAPTENIPQSTSGTTSPTTPPAPTIPTTPPAPKISLPQVQVSQVGNGVRTSIPIPKTDVPINPSAIPGYDQMTQQQKTQALNPNSTPYTTPPATPAPNIVQTPPATPDINAQYNADLTNTQGNIDTLKQRYLQELLTAQQQGDIQKADNAKRLLDYLNTQKTNVTNANQTAVTAENLRNQASVQQIQEVQRRVQEQGISLNQQQRQAELGMRQTAAAIDRTQGAQGGASASIQGAIIAGQNAAALSNDVNTELAIHAQRVAGYNAQMTTSDQQHANALEQLHNSLTSNFDDLNYKLNSALTVTQQQAISKMETAESDLASGKLSMEDFNKMTNGDGTANNPGLYAQMGNSVSELYQRYADTTKAMLDGAQNKFNDILDINKQAQNQQVIDLDNQKFQADQKKFDPTLSNATGIITSLDGQPMLAPNGNPYTFNKEAGDILHTFQDPQTGDLMAIFRDKVTGNKSIISLQSSYTPQQGDIQGAIKNMQSGNADTIKSTLDRMKDQNWSPDAQNQVMQALPSDVQQKIKEQQALDQAKIQDDQKAKDTLAQINSTDPTQRDTGFMSLGTDFMGTIADEAKTADIPLPPDMNSFTFAKNLSDNYRSNGGDLAGAYKQTLQDMSDASPNDANFFANLAKVTGIKIDTLSADLASKTAGTQATLSNAGLSGGNVGTTNTNGQMTDMTQTLQRPQGSENVGQDTNNPTNIMCDNPTEIAYAQSLGAIGTYTSPNRRTYAVFPDMATGKQAGLTDITNKLNGNSLWVTPDTTVAQFASGWTSGQNAPINQTAVKAYCDYLGVSPDTKISSIGASKLEDAVINNEGVDATKDAKVPQVTQSTGSLPPSKLTLPNGDVVDGNQKVAGGVTANDINDIATYNKPIDQVIRGMGVGATQARKQVQDYISAYYPDYDEKNFSTVQALKKSFSGAGPIGTNIMSINTALQHTAEMKKAWGNLLNSNTPMWNSIVNAIAQKTPFSPEQTKALAEFNTAKSAALTEMSKAVRGVGAVTEGEINEWKDKLSDTSQYDAGMSSIDELQKLLIGRLGSIKDYWDSSAKGAKTPVQILGKTTTDAMQSAGFDLTPYNDLMQTGDAGSGTSTSSATNQPEDLSAYHSALETVLRNHGIQ